MSILVDTNVVLRSAQVTHPQYEAADRTVQRLIERKETLVIVPQIIYEFWAVATRPLDRNGLGFTSESTEREISKLERLFVVINDDPKILPRWRQLVLQYDVKGKAAHDARLVAAMDVHGISSLLTFNKADFARYEEISALTPEEILAG